MRTFQSEINNEEILELPLASFNGEIIVVDKWENWEEVINELSKADYIGFDTETKPNFKKGKANQNSVSLLQLSTNSKAYLFRLNKIGLPKPLADILANPNVIKLGVGIQDDIKALQKLLDFEASSFLDLQDYVQSFGITSISLKKIAAIVLSIRISKSQQLSNWESPKLSEGQILYAATDAWMCLEIYQKLKQSIIES